MRDKSKVYSCTAERIKIMPKKHGFLNLSFSEQNKIIGITFMRKRIMERTGAAFCSYCQKTYKRIEQRAAFSIYRCPSCGDEYKSVRVADSESK